MGFCWEPLLESNLFLFLCFALCLNVVGQFIMLYGSSFAVTTPSASSYKAMRNRIFILQTAVGTPDRIMDQGKGKVVLVL